MVKDTRPISEQVKSGLKIGGIIVAILVLLALVVPRISVHRIEAYVWHLRHGNFVGVGSVRFPVPKHWYVMSDSPDSVMLVNLDNGDGISLWSNRQPKGAPLAVWSQLQERSLDHKVQIPAKRRVTFAGEALICIERDDDLQRLHLRSIHCRSESGLEVMFTPQLGVGIGPYDRFYSLVAEAQKSN